MMTKTSFRQGLSRAFGNTSLTCRRYAPEGLLILGIATGVGALISACKQTLEAPKIIEDAKDKLDKIHEVSERDDITKEQYPDDVRKRDITLVYVQTLIKLLKLYSIPIALGTTSFAGILASHNKMKSRNAALASAYTIVDKAFNDYRKRVIEESGEEADQRFRYGLMPKAHDKIEINEDGEAITKRETVEVVDDSSVDNVFVKWFDKTCDEWTTDHDLNMSKLIQTQKYLNWELCRRGHLFLNQAYEALGFKKSQIGQQIGWIYDPAKPNKIDLGLKSPKNADFANGWSEYAIITFKPDGPILHIFEK